MSGGANANTKRGEVRISVSDMSSTSDVPASAGNEECVQGAEGDPNAGSNQPQALEYILNSNVESS